MVKYLNMSNNENKNQINNEEDEEEFEYENCSYDKSLTSICVGGGGMMNGNAYAMVELHNNKYYYVEYGNNPYKKYIGNKIIYDTEGFEYNFNVVEEDEDEEDEEDADEWLFNDNPEFYLMDKTNLDASLNPVNLDWSYEKPNVEYNKVYIFRSDKKK